MRRRSPGDSTFPGSGSSISYKTQALLSQRTDSFCTKSTWETPTHSSKSSSNVLFCFVDYTQAKSITSFCFTPTEKYYSFFCVNISTKSSHTAQEQITCLIHPHMYQTQHKLHVAWTMTVTHHSGHVSSPTKLGQLYISKDSY
jgi:hypothetical protein